MLARIWKSGSLVHSYWDIKWYKHWGKQFGSFIKTLNLQLAYDSFGHLSQRNKNLCSYKNLHMNVYSSLFIITPNYKYLR